MFSTHNSMFTLNYQKRYYTEINKPANLIGKIHINNDEQIKRMRASCKKAANILQMCHEIVQVCIYKISFLYSSMLNNHELDLQIYSFTDIKKVYQVKDSISS